MLKVPDERALFEFKAMADAAGIVNCVITDAGRTEIAPGTVTCLGIGPAPESAVDKITGELKSTMTMCGAADLKAITKDKVFIP